MWMKSVKQSIKYKLIVSFSSILVFCLDHIFLTNICEAQLNFVSTNFSYIHILYKLREINIHKLTLSLTMKLVFRVSYARVKKYILKLIANF